MHISSAMRAAFLSYPVILDFIFPDQFYKTFFTATMFRSSCTFGSLFTYFSISPASSSILRTALVSITLHYRKSQLLVDRYLTFMSVVWSELSWFSSVSQNFVAVHSSPFTVPFTLHQSRFCRAQHSGSCGSQWGVHSGPFVCVTAVSSMLE